MSNIKWEAAANMEQIQFRRIFRPIVRPVPVNASIVTAYTDGEVTLRSNRNKIGYHEAATLDGYQGVEPGDFVVHGLDIMRGSVGISDSEGAISSVCIVCEPLQDVDLRYIAYLIRAQAHSGYPKALARGVRDGGADFRRWDTLAELPVPRLDAAEQRAISDFLDRETAEIDAFIGESERLIELLNERRTATITQAVTKGLNPDAPMKDSGIEWLGEVPEHWSIVRTRFLAMVSTGFGDTIDSVPDGEFPFYVRSDTPERSNIYHFDEQAVLTSGDGAGVGKVFHLVAGKFAAHQRVYVIHDFSRDVVASFFYFVFSTFFHYVALDGSAKSTVDSVRRHMLTDFPIPLPTEEEQIKIVSHLEKVNQKTDAAITTAREAIALARERRQALISAAVTGKIDVRSAP